MLWVIVIQILVAGWIISKIWYYSNQEKMDDKTTAWLVLIFMLLIWVLAFIPIVPWGLYFILWKLMRHDIEVLNDTRYLKSKVYDIEDEAR